MCDIVFDKVQDRAGKVNRTSVYAEAAVRRVLLKGFLSNFPEFTNNHLCQNLYFDKVKLCRPATSLKTLEQVFSSEICEICWNTFFAEHHPTTASDCSSINCSEGRIGKQNRKLLKRESK